jgi:hypothetical protein
MIIDQKKKTASGDSRCCGFQSLGSWWFQQFETLSPSTTGHASATLQNGTRPTPNGKSDALYMHFLLANPPKWHQTNPNVGILIHYTCIFCTPTLRNGTQPTSNYLIRRTDGRGHFANSTPLLNLSISSIAHTHTRLQPKP